MFWWMRSQLKPNSLKYSVRGSSMNGTWLLPLAPRRLVGTARYDLQPSDVKISVVQPEANRACEIGGQLGKFFVVIGGV